MYTLIAIKTSTRQLNLRSRYFSVLGTLGYKTIQTGNFSLILTSDLAYWTLQWTLYCFLCASGRGSILECRLWSIIESAACFTCRALLKITGIFLPTRATIQASVSCVHNRPTDQRPPSVANSQQVFFCQLVLKVGPLGKKVGPLYKDLKKDFS